MVVEDVRPVEGRQESAYSEVENTAVEQEMAHIYSLVEVRQETRYMVKLLVEWLEAPLSGRIVGPVTQSVASTCLLQKMMVVADQLKFVEAR